MTLEQLRDEFAAAALTGLLASWHRGNAGRLFDFDSIVADAYAAADAMLHQRRAYCPVCQQQRAHAKAAIVHESGCEYGWQAGVTEGL